MLHYHLLHPTQFILLSQFILVSFDSFLQHTVQFRVKEEQLLEGSRPLSSAVRIITVVTLPDWYYDKSRHDPKQGTSLCAYSLLGNQCCRTEVDHQHSNQNFWGSNNSRMLKYSVQTSETFYRSQTPHQTSSGRSLAIVSALPAKTIVIKRKWLHFVHSCSGLFNYNVLHPTFSWCVWMGSIMLGLMCRQCS